MPIPIGFLLALQAGGMVVDYLGKSEQVRLGRMAEQIEQAGIEANIQQARLETEDQSLQALIELRKNLGTQAAVAAARGVSVAAGSSIVARQESLSTAGSDERMRRLNLMARETQLKSQMTLSKLHQQTNANNQWNTFRQNVLSRFPTNLDSISQIAKGFSAKEGYGFGLTKVGG